MPRGSRAFHSKSRNGCGQCKKRKVRCDFQAPICKNCKRRGQACDYQQLLPATTIPRDTRPPSDALIVNARLQASQERHDRTVGVMGIRPGETFSLFDDEGQIWDTEFAGLAQRQPFLQHVVLALASLQSHLTTTPNSGYLYAAACAHHLEASRLFRLQISDLSERNWLAALVFAIGVGIFHFGISKSEPTTSIMESMFVMRNASLLANEISPWFQASSMHSRIHSKLTNAAITLDGEAALAYERLFEFNASCTTDERARHIYCDAIANLRQWLVMTSGNPRSWGHFICWPSTLGSEYMLHLARREPMALVIFVHWCAVMNNVPKRWFLDGWAVRVAVPIIETLGHGWNDVLEWPRKVLGLRAVDELGKVITLADER